MTQENLFSVAFYNTENLFDYKDDKHTLDSDYTPSGRKKWGAYRYQHKVNKIAKVISKIATKDCVFPPTLIGLAEVENKKVVLDVAQSEALKYLNYDCVHYNSPDERGIDVALLYHKDFFEVIHSKAIPVQIFEPNGVKDDTRDILYVQGKLHGELTHVFVNHWPSRRKGVDKTALKRMELAHLLSYRLDEILTENPLAKIIIMGDFNDDPNSESVLKLTSEHVANPMEKLHTQTAGSLSHNGVWHLFDQILHSASFQKNTGHQFVKAAIYNEEFLTDWTGRSKGSPLRTYIGKFYRGGFSDHFPVYTIFKKSY